MNSTPIRIGFIGYGRVAESHFRALSSCEVAKLTMVTGHSAERARIKASSWGVGFMESPEEMVASDLIDAVFVLTPTESHYYYSEIAIRNGKHVLVEKPVSYNLEEIHKLEELATRYEVQCMPGHSYLYLPEIRRMARYATEKQAGTPFYLFMSEIYKMPEKYILKYHGPLREVLCHEIYIMLALLGIPSKIQGFSNHFRDMPEGSEEQVAANLQFPSGAITHLFLSWAGEDETSDPWTFKIKFLGLNGGFHFSRRDVVTEVQNQNPPWEYPLYDEMFRQEVDFFINKCILKQEKPLSTLREAYNALRIMLAVEESIRNNTIVEFS